MTRRTVILIGVVVLQLAVILSLVVRYEWRLWRGAPIVLETVPVDPRDLFRGDYVDLDYNIDLPEGLEDALSKDCQKRDAWMILSRSETAVSEFIRLEFAPPQTLSEQEAALKVQEKCGTIVFDESIRRYYVPEGSGRALEASVRDGRLTVVLATTPEGQATIAALQLDGEVMSDEGLF